MKGETGRRVMEAMERAGLKAADLVRASGGEITYARITNWKRGDNDPSRDVLPLLSRLTGATVDELLGSKPICSERAGKRPRRAFGAREADVPKILPVHAGMWSDPFDTDDFEPLPSFMVDDLTFCCIVEGDSMFPMLFPGDVAVFKADRTERIGRVVLARSAHGGMSIRVLKHDGREFVLAPLNPACDAVPRSEWRIEGFLTGIVRDESGEKTIRHSPKGLMPRT